MNLGYMHFYILCVEYTNTNKIILIIGLFLCLIKNMWQLLNDLHSLNLFADVR